MGGQLLRTGPCAWTPRAGSSSSTRQRCGSDEQQKACKQGRTQKATAPHAQRSQARSRPEHSAHLSPTMKQMAGWWEYASTFTAGQYERKSSSPSESSPSRLPTEPGRSQLGVARSAMTALIVSSICAAISAASPPIESPSTPTPSVAQPCGGAGGSAMPWRRAGLLGVSSRIACPHPGPGPGSANPGARAGAPAVVPATCIAPTRSSR